MISAWLFLVLLNLCIVVNDASNNYTFIPGNFEISNITIKAAREQFWKGRYPFFASIRRKRHHVCGGAIIAPRLVLTAAHCFQDRSRKVNEYTVVVGQNLFKNRQIRYNSIERIIIAPVDVEHFTNDLALILLKNELSYSIFVRDVAMAPVILKNTLTAASYAPYKHSKKDLKANFLELKLIEEDAVCRSNDRLFCAMSERKTKNTLCSYAAGVPIVDSKTQLLVGISAMKSPKCDTHPTAAFTRLSAFYDWFRLITGLESVRGV